MGRCWRLRIGFETIKSIEMIHKTAIEGYYLTELAEKIGDLRYDALADFLKELSLKIEKDGLKDESRGRVKLATQLKKTADELKTCSENIKVAWDICEPFTK